MPTLLVTGSNIMALYHTGSLVIHHTGSIYDLEAPLDLGSVDRFSVNKDKDFRVHMKDGSELTLKRRSKEEVDQYHDENDRKLRILQKEHAKQALKYVKTIRKAAKGLVQIEQRLCAGATKIAGEYHNVFHTISLQRHGPNEIQIENKGDVTTPDFESVLEMADWLVERLEPVVSTTEPLPLIHEMSESDSD